MLSALAAAQIVRVPNSQPTPPAANSQDDNVIKIRADLINVLVSVTDARGNLVNSLKQDDFEIFEDDLSQEIVTFGRENSLPLRMVVLFDISSSVKPRLKFEQQAAVKFFKSMMRPIDQAALFSFNHDVTIEQNFTADVEALSSHTHSLKAHGATALYDAIYLAAEHLEKMPGRHVIVIISDGANLISRATLESAMRMAERADAAIYGIYTATRLAEDAERNYYISGDQELQRICERTGGQVFFPKDVNDLDENFNQLAAVLRAQYSISYYSKNEKHDGSYRALRISVKNPDLKARTRKGYYAPKG
jgi:Ca-activated chloride channel family protein